ncbi:type I secretion system permease/ATPase [Methylotuvimicrobium alcaliphilum]|uniref:Alkaline protease secretion ATP-binding protein AprD n=1 Tax=Methylotuvimicrobium alcaliphilum (strain DSM 19304 / NCIMB 14124 / VKM B-2133 / 20Z) TaxID=1091494 RepID=G4T3V9_META2|nr:type I secretion system permease/ATPase [Methylotuvimicrobium alcaliphilum]CCE22658.1 Alkaline protease secretion ATP-binding protein AprD [Methylotuvimicrobium alcaliphilum 20Z]
MKVTEKSDLEDALKLCKSAFLSAAGFSMLINFLMITPSIYMLQVYDRVVSTGNKSTLVMLTLIVLGLYVTLAALEWVRSQILVRVSTRLETLLNQRLFQVAFKQALLSGGQRATTQPLDDLTGLRQFLTGNGLFAFFDAPWMPFYLGLLFLFHPLYGWFSVVTAILLCLVALANEKVTSKTLSEANTTNIATRGMLQKNLRNAEVIESMGMLGNIRRRWMSGAVKMLDLQAVASSRAGILTSLSKFIRISSQSLILGLGAYLVIEREISPGLMIAGSILMGRALAPIDLMIGTWKGFINARDQYGRLNAILLQIPADSERMQLPDPKGNIQLENAVVVPPGSKTPALKGINVTIDSGDIVGIIGPSGAGKSTMARAVLGIWPTANGAIRLDGAEVFQWDREHLGGFIGYLPQDIELFEGTISENIARFGEIDSQKVVEAAKMADVHELILQLPEGYDTVIGAGGGTLSGGQRQRIGLARAIYGNPVLVVLDEPNSNLDDQGESALEKALMQLKQKNTTVLIITHRKNVLDKADKLLILKDGVLAAYGPKNQVLAHLQQQASSAAAKS